MSREIVVAALSRIPAFAGLDETVLENMARAGRLVQLPPRAVVFHARDKVDRVYIVLAGEIGLGGDEGKGGPASVAGAGSVLGAAAFLDGGEWPVAGRVLEGAILFAFAGRLLDHLDARHGPLGLLVRQRLRRDDALQAFRPGDAASAAGLPEELYPKRHTCPCCGAVFASAAVRSRFARVVRTDTDFCPHFEGVNPLFYEVVVCEACGYAFDELDSEPLNPAARRIARERCAGAPPRGFGGPRGLEQAVAAHRLALGCQEAVEARPSVRARTCLKLAWFYRYAGDETAEREALRTALEHYRRAFEREPRNDAKHELRLLYLIGELHRRLGERAEAVQWFGRVIGHPWKEANPQIVRMARDQWQEIRYRSRGEGVGPPGNGPG